MRFTIALVLLVGLASARVTFPSRVWAEPGRNLEVVCKSSQGTVVRIYGPNEPVPGDQELLELRKVLKKLGGDFGQFRVQNKQEYKNAQEEDSGIYTCLVFYEDDEYPMEIATSNIQIVDLCASVTCEFPRKCEADYTSGTHECTCNYDCDATDVNLFCTDTCELYFNECHLAEVTCRDGIQRTVLNKGLCPQIVEPTVRQYRNELTFQPEYGEEVYFHSGLVGQGNPPATITWYKDGQELPQFANLDMITLTASPEWVGDYTTKIVHCRADSRAILNSFTVLEPEVEGLGAGGVYPVCSVYPGGVVEQFSGHSHVHDLACTHVLAANSLVNNDYSQGWYVYGMFDEHDGNTALMTMTFYVGSTAFEFQRGWVVNVDGSKLQVEEDVAVSVGVCEVVFSALHLRADCPEFTAYYDGVMTGHVKYNEPVLEGAQLRETEFGLCWDDGNSFMVNWQVKFLPECMVEESVPGCSEAHASCDVLSCGTGSRMTCSQLNCEGGVPTSTQQCALAQADKVNCALKTAGEVTERQMGETCPGDECVWKLDLVKRGCPQEDPPFRC